MQRVWAGDDFKDRALQMLLASRIETICPRFRRDFIVRADKDHLTVRLPASEIRRADEPVTLTANVAAFSSRVASCLFPLSKEVPEQDNARSTSYIQGVNPNASDTLNLRVHVKRKNDAAHVIYVMTVRRERVDHVVAEGFRMIPTPSAQQQASRKRGAESMTSPNPKRAPSEPTTSEQE